MNRINSFLLILFLCFWSCNTISSEDFVMTDDNTDRFSLPKAYWAGVDEDGKVSDTVGYSARGFSEDTRRRIWIMDLQPNPDRLPPVYIRYQKNGENEGVYQITSYDEDGRHINFLYGKYHPEKAELILYEPSDAALGQITEFTKTHDLKGDLILKKDELVFNQEAARQSADLLIKFLKSIDQKEHFKDSLILRGTNDQEEYRSWLKPTR